MKYLALDFGGSSVKYGLVDGESAQITNTGKEPAPLRSIEEFVDTVGKLYDRFRGEIGGIGISLPGNIDPNTGYLFGNGVYTNLYEHSIYDLLKDRCPVPIAVENDGKCGALSEAWKGGLSDVKDGAVVILGSGIAGGLIKDGKIHSGLGFNAGEFSYLITAPEDYSMFSCAFMNCAALGITYKLMKLKNLDPDAQDSAPTMHFLDSMYAGRYPAPQEPLAKIKADGRQFFRWVEEGDEAALQVYREAIKSLAILIFNVQICYAPEMIVIGGGLSGNDKFLEDTRGELRKIYAAQGTMPSMYSVVVKSAYTDECNLLGATYNLLLRI